MWWYVRSPIHRGAVIAVWLGDDILMIRHSYRDRLSWPGGGIKTGEAAVDAARRELNEELGLAVDRASLSFVGEVLELWEHRRDYVSIFELKLAASPALTLDRREVIGAQFMTPDAALASPLIPFIATYLRDHGRQGAAT